MDTEVTYLQLKTIALQEFPDIIISISLMKGPLTVTNSLRICFLNGSRLEVWISEGKYSYHWQRKGGTIYRFDNVPHKKHYGIATFPNHFHDGSEHNVKESTLSNDPQHAIKEVLAFVRTLIA